MSEEWEEQVLLGVAECLKKGEPHQFHMEVGHWNHERNNDITFWLWVTDSSDVYRRFLIETTRVQDDGEYEYIGMSVHATVDAAMKVIHAYRELSVEAFI